MRNGLFYRCSRYWIRGTLSSGVRAPESVSKNLRLCGRDGGLERTVLPLLADQEFGVASASAALSFILTFTLRFNDVRLSDNTLTFWFEPGPRVECTLQRREDGAFAGSCKDPQAAPRRC